MHGLKHKPNGIHSQNVRDLSAQIGQERFEFNRVEHPQNRTVYLVGTRQVLVGGCDDVAMRIFQPVETRFQPVHRNATQIHDVSTHGTFIRGNKRLHDIIIIQNDVRL